MRPNRSVPDARIMPELAYRDVRAASEWLCRAFGLEIRLVIGTHRVQLVFGEGAIVAVEPRPDGTGERSSVLVRVTGIDEHHRIAKASGAIILSPPTDQVYGERQYAALDSAGHHWTFSETIADVAPSEWGGEMPIDP